MTVEGKHRPVAPTDVVYDCGNLPEWSIIPCRDYQPLRLPVPDLMVAIASLASRADRSITAMRCVGIDVWRINADDLRRPIRRTVKQILEAPVMRGVDNAFAAARNAGRQCLPQMGEPIHLGEMSTDIPMLAQPQPAYFTERDMRLHAQLRKLPNHARRK